MEQNHSSSVLIGFEKELSPVQSLFSNLTDMVLFHISSETQPEDHSWYLYSYKILLDEYKRR